MRPPRLGPKGAARLFIHRAGGESSPPSVDRPVAPRIFSANKPFGATKAIAACYCAALPAKNAASSYGAAFQRMQECGLRVLSAARFLERCLQSALRLHTDKTID